MMGESGRERAEIGEEEEGGGEELRFFEESWTEKERKSQARLLFTFIMGV